MSRLTNVDDIWTLSATKAELQRGSLYAEISLPWTFNRMMLNTGSRGQQERGLNIAKGIVAQEVLIRTLRSRGLVIKEQQKSHRDEDLFDLVLPNNGNEVRFDLKSLNYYTNYNPMGRIPLSPDFILQNKDYTGPEWARFFPMLIPHTQITQDKHAYCFAIASSIDPRNRSLRTRTESESRLVAFPYGEHLPFLTFKRLCLAREMANSGFSVTVSYQPDNLFGGEAIQFELIGEWDANVTRINLSLESGEYVEDVGPFSCLSAFSISSHSFDVLSGVISISITRNDFTDQFLNTQRVNVNVPPITDFHLSQADFCDLNLPLPYEIHFLGWIEKEDFLQRYKSYPSWVWPDDRIDSQSNRNWTQITERDKKLLDKLGLDYTRQSPDGSIRAGLMKTTGHGGGACCYVFPNVPIRGGVSETNLYVLPNDLRPMNSLIPELG